MLVVVVRSQARLCMCGAPRVAESEVGRDDEGCDGLTAVPPNVYSEKKREK